MVLSLVTVKKKKIGMVLLLVSTMHVTGIENCGLILLKDADNCFYSLVMLLLPSNNLKNFPDAT